MSERRIKPISQEALCAEYEAVYRYVLTLCREESEAQDVTQETFFKALKAANRFEGGSSLYTWLCAIAKNLWLNRCKKKKHEAAAADLEATLPDAGTPMEQKLAERELSLQIHRVLHQLKEPYKEVFSLRVFGQLPMKEIAVLFSKTEGWARVTYYRAKQMIQETLRKEGD